MAFTSKIGKKKPTGLYFKNIITRKVQLPFKYIGGNIEKLITENLKEKMEGKCINEGYIKRKRSSIILMDCDYKDKISAYIDNELSNKAKSILFQGILNILYSILVIYNNLSISSDCDRMYYALISIYLI